MTDIAEETDGEHYLLQAKIRTPEMEMSVLGACLLYTSPSPRDS